MTDIQTYIFYGLVVFACLLLSWYSERTDKKSGLAICAVLLILVAGFRSYDVGIDTSLYKNGIEYFYENGHVSWEVSFSYGYGVFASFLFEILHDYTFVLLIEAAITNGLILARLWDFRNSSSLTFMVLIYLCTAYFVSLCIICQYVAIALFFYGSRFADRGKPVIYCVFIILAAFLHVSALIAFLDVVLRYFRLKGASSVGLLIRLFIIAITPVVLILIGQVFLERYSNYMMRASSVGLMVPVQATIFILALFVNGYFASSRRCKRFNLKSELSEGAPYAVRLYFLGLILSASSYVIANAGRIAYYFIIYGSVCFGAIAKHSSESKNRLACSLILAGWFVFYCIYACFINGSLGIAPYSFIWD